MTLRRTALVMLASGSLVLAGMCAGAMIARYALEHDPELVALGKLESRPAP